VPSLPPAAAITRAQWLAPEKLRGCGALLLNSSGQRFVDELSTRDKVADALMQQVGCRQCGACCVACAS
jgi:cleavage and polyadenylation specificity factor subunit 2